MTATGQAIIAGVPTSGTAGVFRAVDPSTGEPIGPQVSALTTAELGAATATAAAAFPAYRATSPQDRAGFLDAIAEQIEAVGDELVETAMAESGLPAVRVQGERARTCGQLRAFARVVRQGDHLGVRVDPALPRREPLPRPDLRMRQVPIGPVAVFGASNFPLAFSTAGGDTASALAAGCPVVVKGHNAHPATAELVGRAIARAAEQTGMPAGVFSLVFGTGNEIGTALVTDPAIQGVGFTGSRGGGLALVEAAARRPQPIPVYAEMSSVNPVVVLPGALGGDLAALATGYVTSLTNGAGQFCTNPGLLFLPTGALGDRFLDAVGAAVRASAGQTMLTPQIRAHFDERAAYLAGAPAVTVVATGSPGDSANAPAPTVFATGLADFVAQEELAEEVFGAAGLVIRYADIGSLARALSGLEGQLTATIHGTDADLDSARTLLPVLETRAGRILWGGWPTGVEVSEAMVHGGPYPATSDPRTTSVGTLAIERWQRPVCYQDLPAQLLPEPVRDDNPWRLVRRVDGTLQLP